MTSAPTCRRRATAVALSRRLPTPLDECGRVFTGLPNIKPGDQIRISCAPHTTPGATACLSREIHINGKLVALSADQAKQVLAAGGK